MIYTLCTSYIVYINIKLLYRVSLSDFLLSAYDLKHSFNSEKGYIYVTKFSLSMFVNCTVP